MNKTDINSGDEALEIEEHDAKIEDAVRWVVQQSGRGTFHVNSLKVPLQIRDENVLQRIVETLRSKGIIQTPSWASSPNTVEAAIADIDAALATLNVPRPSAPVVPVSRPDPFAIPVIESSAPPILDTNGNEWMGNFDRNLTGQGRVEYTDGTIEEGIFENGLLVNGERIHGEGLTKGNIDKGEFKDGYLSNGLATHKDGTYVHIAMAEGNDRSGKGKKEYDHGTTEEGEFDDFSFTKGKRVGGDGTIKEGEFLYFELKKGRKTLPDGSFCDIDMTEGNDYIGTGSKKWNSGEMQEGEFYVGHLQNGTVTHADGTVTKLINGREEGSIDAPEVRSEPSHRWVDVDTSAIKSFRENATIDKPLLRNKAANEGIKRLESLCETLPEADQRLIGELYIVFKDRLPPAPSKFGALFAKGKGEKVPAWKAMDIQVENTVVIIDPLRLPTDDNEIKQYLVMVAKKYANQRKAEREVDALREATQVYGVALNYDQGVPNFLLSLPGIEKIKRAMMNLSEEETADLSRSDMLILMSGQKEEDYLTSKYKVIISCDTPLSEDKIASYLRGKLRNAGDTATESGEAPTPHWIPAKKSVPSVLSKTRGRLTNILAGLAIASGAGAVYVATHKAPAAPTDVAKKPTPAPKAEEAPKTEITKVDLDKVNIGDTVTFESLEDGAAKGVVSKTITGKYRAAHGFKFTGTGHRAVIRTE